MGRSRASHGALPAKALRNSMVIERELQLVETPGDGISSSPRFPFMPDSYFRPRPVLEGDPTTPALERLKQGKYESATSAEMIDECKGVAWVESDAKGDQRRCPSASWWIAFSKNTLGQKQQH
jgi:hypothetical protein